MRQAVSICLVAAALALPSLRRAAEAQPCAPEPADGVQAVCGSVEVPLDRWAPDGGLTVAIAYELYPRADASEPPLGTVGGSRCFCPT